MREHTQKTVNRHMQDDIDTQSCQERKPQLKLAPGRIREEILKWSKKRHTHGIDKSVKAVRLARSEQIKDYSQADDHINEIKDIIDHLRNPRCPPSPMHLSLFLFNFRHCIAFGSPSSGDTT